MEERGAVFANGHGPFNFLRDFVVRHAAARHGRRRLADDGIDAQRFHLRAEIHAADVRVLDIDQAGLVAVRGRQGGTQIRRHGTALNRNRADGRHVRIDVDLFAAAHRVDQPDTIGVDRLDAAFEDDRFFGTCHKRKFFIQRPRRRKRMLRAAFAFGEALFRRDSRQRFGTVFAELLVDVDDGARRVGMVGHRRRDDFVRARNQPRLRDHVGVARIVAVEMGRARAVRTHRPEALVDRVMTVDVVPPRVDDTAVRQDARIPFVRFAIGERTDVLAVAVHPVEEIGGRVAAAVATSEGLATR